MLKDGGYGVTHVLIHFTGIFLHDPTCLAALLDPTLFTFKKGAVRVETEGLCVGHTLLDLGLKKYVNMHYPHNSCLVIQETLPVLISSELVLLITLGPRYLVFAVVQLSDNIKSSEALIPL